jgi:hypothetical protein
MTRPNVNWNRGGRRWCGWSFNRRRRCDGAAPFAPLAPFALNSSRDGRGYGRNGQTCGRASRLIWHLGLATCSPISVWLRLW